MERKEGGRIDAGDCSSDDDVDSNKIRNDDVTINNRYDHNDNNNNDMHNYHNDDDVDIMYKNIMMILLSTVARYAYRIGYVSDTIRPNMAICPVLGSPYD